MIDPERLTDLEEIKLLKARRDRAVDTKDWDLYLSLHVPDHVSHNEGYPRWGTAAEMIENVKRQLGPETISVHHSHSPEITFETPERANGIWGMEDKIYEAATKRLLVRGYGFYHETYEKRDGRWLFTYRQLRRTLVETY